jgi:hypothetical protein
MGKRKSVEDDSAGDGEAAAESPTQRNRRTSNGAAENGTPGQRSSGRARTVVQAFDPSKPYDSPSEKQPGSGKKQKVQIRFHNISYKMCSIRVISVSLS